MSHAVGLTSEGASVGRAHLCWRVCACLNCCHVCMEFHACRPTRLSCHDSTYDRICTIRLGRERAPSEDIKLLAFILHLHWTLCLIDCLKEKERGKNPWMWKEVKIPRPKLWKRQLRGAGGGARSFRKLRRLVEGAFWLDFCKEARVTRIKPLNRMLRGKLGFAWVQNVK